jgi:hypothetical protein
MTTVPNKKPWFGIAGSGVGILAVLAAVLPMWILPALSPPRPIDKVVVDTAEKIKDRVAAKLKGTQYKEVERQFDWYRAFAMVAVMLGVLAIALAVASFLVGEPRRYSGVSAALGVGAIVFQFVSWLGGAIVGAAILLLLLSLFT